jgi:Phage integrase, N-terminal SAM-like domain
MSTTERSRTVVWLPPCISGTHRGCASGSKPLAIRRRLHVGGFATLGEAMAAGVSGYSPRSTFADVAADWLESLDELVAAGRRSPRTVALYRHALRRHVLPGLGGLRLSELTSARLDRFIRDRRRAAGYSVAKLCRSVTSGVCAFAVRRDAMRQNPVRDVDALESPSTQEVRHSRTRKPGRG